MLASLLNRVALVTGSANAWGVPLPSVWQSRAPTWSFTTGPRKRRPARPSPRLKSWGGVASRCRLTLPKFPNFRSCFRRWGQFRTARHPGEQRRELSANRICVDDGESMGCFPGYEFEGGVLLLPGRGAAAQKIEWSDHQFCRYRRNSGLAGIHSALDLQGRDHHADALPGERTRARGPRECNCSRYDHHAGRSARVGSRLR